MPAGPADLIIENAKIWTGDAKMPAPEAAAIRDGRFLRVGRAADLADLRGQQTRVIDAHGRRMIPGICDAHVHLISGGEQLGRLNLRDAPDRKAFVSAVREYAATRRMGQWILGGRWSTESWSDSAQPTRDWIDAATGDVPVLLDRMDGHGALANSAALKRAGIDAQGPADPPGGRIERDPKTGEPTGILKETAIDLVRKFVPPPTAEEQRAGLMAAMAEANRFGVTSVHTMSQWGDMAVLDAVREAKALTLRVRVYVMEDDWSAFIERAAAHRADDFLRVVGFKQFADGSLGSRTAYMAEPFADNPPDRRDNRGLPQPVLSPPSRLESLCRAARAQGFGCAIHAIGDQANHDVLDVYKNTAAVGIAAGGAINSATAPLAAATTTTASPIDIGENAAAADPPFSRHAQRRASPPSAAAMPLRIEHAQHLLPDDIARFAKLGIVASMQPYHKADDGRYTEKVIGRERCKTSYAFRSLLDRGATLAFGSDFPVVTLNPFMGVHAAVTGKTLDGKIFVPEQNLTVEQALIAYTRGGAIAAGDDARLGRIAPGYLADFAILNDDILTMSPDDLPNTWVAYTYVNGRQVWPAAGP